MAAAGDWILTDTTIRKIVTGQFDLDTDQFKVMLFTSASDIGPAKGAASSISGEVAAAAAPGNGYTAGGLVVNMTVGVAAGTVAAPVGFYFAADPVFTVPNGGSNLVFRWAALVEAGGDLVAYSVQDSAPADVVVTPGNTFSVKNGANSPVIAFRRPT